MRNHYVELNWRSRSVRPPRVLKGHDEHVITCLQFNDHKIVSGSDDRTVKVWDLRNMRAPLTNIQTDSPVSSDSPGNDKRVIFVVFRSTKSASAAVGWWPWLRTTDTSTSTISPVLRLPACPGTRASVT